MTPQEARELVNHEQELYDARLAAWNAWADDDTYMAYCQAVTLWQSVRDAVRQAQCDYPHLFAPFAAVTQ